MSPLRGDVLALAFVLALPLLAMGWRGDMSLSDVTARLPWCLAAAWGAVALLRWAARPRNGSTRRGAHTPAPAPAEEHPAD
jgi:hypothetical protein